MLKRPKANFNTVERFVEVSRRKGGRGAGRTSPRSSPKSSPNQKVPKLRKGTEIKQTVINERNGKELDRSRNHSTSGCAGSSVHKSTENTGVGTSTLGAAFGCRKQHSASSHVKPG